MELKKSFMDSKVVREISYNQEEKSIDVLFVSGKKFRYFDFPAEMWEDACRAYSIGSFIHKIKPHYRCEQIPT
jgi:hypothetical protein